MRITIKTLRTLCDILNDVTGSPSYPYTRTETGARANIGNFYISQCYGGYSLHRMMNDGGGVDDIFRSGHMPARELYNRMSAYIDGIQDTKRGF